MGIHTRAKFNDSFNFYIKKNNLKFFQVQSYECESLIYRSNKKEEKKKELVVIPHFIFSEEVAPVLSGINSSLSP